MLWNIPDREKVIYSFCSPVEINKVYHLPDVTTNDITHGDIKLRGRVVIYKCQEISAMVIAVISLFSMSVSFPLCLVQPCAYKKQTVTKIFSLVMFATDQFSTDKWIISGLKIMTTSCNVNKNWDVYLILLTVLAFTKHFCF